MARYSARHIVGNRKGALEIYLKHLPAKGNRRSLLKNLQWFNDLIVVPPTISLGLLNSIRLYAAQCVVADAVAQNCLAYALEAALLAKAAPKEKPFSFNALDAWQIYLDQKRIQHDASKGGAV